MFLFGFLRNCFKSDTKSSNAIARNFVKERISLNDAQAMSFGELQERLKNDATTDLYKSMLQIVLNEMESDTSNSPHVYGIVNPRIITVALMFAMYPDKAFYTQTLVVKASGVNINSSLAHLRALEDEVIASSNSMLNAFYKTAEDLAKDKPWSVAKGNLPHLLCRYLKAVRAWKPVDEGRIIRQLASVMNVLDNAIRDCEDDEMLAKLDEKKKLVMAKFMEFEAKLSKYDANHNIDNATSLYPVVGAKEAQGIHTAIPLYPVVGAKEAQEIHTAIPFYPSVDVPVGQLLTPLLSDIK